MLQSHSHDTLINHSDLNNGWSQPAEDSYSHDLEVGTVGSARPVVGVPPTTDLTTARTPQLREPSCIHHQATELGRQKRQLAQDVPGIQA